MEEDEFLSTENLTKAITKRKTNVDKNKVNWLKIQWLRYDKEKEYSILYKYTLDEDYAHFQELDLKPAKKGRPLSLALIEQEKLYNSPRVMSYLKKRDMLYLLKYIPPVHHAYFRNIKSSQDEEDIGPLLDDEYDEEDKEYDEN